jgi:small subunit ribosomal protein S1
LVHVSDLSWTRKIKHPSEFVKVGDEMEVVVLELDVDNRRLALSHKHLEENPWDTFETVFTPGSVHKCTVINVNEKGAILELPYGIEGFATMKNIEKEDGSKAKPGETLEFKVMEFSKDDKRILLSHKAVYGKAEEAPKPAKKSARPTSGPAKAGQEVEKSTLGDLEALSALKEQMEGEAEAKINKARKAAEAEKAEDEAPKAKKAAKKEDDASEEDTDA